MSTQNIFVHGELEEIVNKYFFLTNSLILQSHFTFTQNVSYINRNEAVYLN